MVTITQGHPSTFKKMHGVDAAAAASPGRMSELIFSLLLDDWSASGTSRYFFLRHQSETSIIWLLTIFAKSCVSHSLPVQHLIVMSRSISVISSRRAQQQQQSAVFLPVLQRGPLVSSDCLFYSPEFVSALEKLLVYGLSLNIRVEWITPVPQSHSWVGSTAACNWEQPYI